MPIGRVGYLSRGRVQHTRPRLETWEEHCARAGRRGWAETKSAERLAAVWAERDAEIEQRLGGPPGMSYRFKCRFCESRFSLEQQLNDHEQECGKVGTGQADQEDQTAGKSPQVRKCKYCHETFTNFGEYGTHRWAAHRDEVMADLKKSRERRKTDEAKIDAAIQRKPDNGAVATKPGGRPRSEGPETTSASPCPLCGGALPASTAQLVGELTAAGLSEDQAFSAAKIARRVLGQGASA